MTVTMLDRAPRIADPGRMPEREVHRPDPQVQLTPGLAEQMLRELAPLLAEEGIDVDNIDVPDLQTLQRALTRAVERRNLELFNPVGATREIAVTTLRAVVEAILADDSVRAEQLLGQVQPDSPENTVATVASRIGIALGLLDDWLCQHPEAADIGAHTTLPAGHHDGERAAVDILALAHNGNAFHSLDKLLVRHGGPQVLTGSALALAAATTTMAHTTNMPTNEMIHTLIR
jgi:hypothetical protein